MLLHKDLKRKEEDAAQAGIVIEAKEKLASSLPPKSHLSMKTLLMKFWFVSKGYSILHFQHNWAWFLHFIGISLPLLELGSKEKISLNNDEEEDSDCLGLSSLNIGKGGLSNQPAYRETSAIALTV